MLSLIATLAGLVLPPVVDIAKHKLGVAPKNTEEAFLEVASKNPEQLSAYVEAQAKLMDSKVKYFNRDVIGAPSQWVVDLRSGIRPVATLGCFGLIGADGAHWITLSPDSVSTCWFIASSWFGDKLRRPA